LRLRRNLFLALLSWLFIQPYAWCDTQNNITLVGKIAPENVQDLCLKGNYAYLLENNSLVTLDISNPASPQSVSNYQPTTNYGSFQQIALDGNRLYLKNYSGQFVILDIGNPAIPVEIGSYSFPDNYYFSAFHGNYAYLFSTNLVHIIDMTTPSAGKEVNAIIYSETVNQALFSGNYMYLAEDTVGLRIMDVSVANTPTAAGSCYISGGGRTLALTHPYLYVGSGASDIAIIDVTNPLTPLSVGFIANTPADSEIYINGNSLYAVGRRTNGAYYSSGEKITINDITSRTSPIKISESVLPTTTNNYFLGGSYLFANIADFGIRIYSPANPSTGSEIGSFGHSGTISGMSIAGQYAYLAAQQDGLRILDISHPDQPHEINYVYITNNATAVWSNGSTAYIGTDYCNLYIWDLSNPSSPRSLGSLIKGDPYTSITDIAVQGNTAYLTAEDGIHILDVSNPQSPVETKLIRNSGMINSSAIMNNLAYLGTSGGLQIFDLTSDREVGSNTQIGSIYGIWAAGRYIYTVGSKGICVFLQDWYSSPQMVGNPVQNSFQDITAIGKYILTAAPSSVSLYDLTDLENPRNIGYFSPNNYRTYYGGYPYSVKIVTNGNYIYWTSGSNGFWILSTSNTGGALPSGRNDIVEVRGGAKGYVLPSQGEKVKVILRPVQSGRVTVHIYSLRGQLVWSQDLSVTAGGLANLEWNCENNNFSPVASGVYLIRISGAGINENKRTVVIQ
jgi:hypothetical protein